MDPSSGFPLASTVAIRVLRPRARDFQGHGRRDHGGVVVEERPRIQQPKAIREELMTAADKGRLPVAAVVLVRALVTTRENKRPNGGVAHGGRLGQDLLHASVRRKGLSFLDPNGGEQPQHFRVLGVGGLFLNDLVQFFIKAEIIGMDGIERLARHVDPFLFGRMHSPWTAGKCAYVF